MDNGIYTLEDLIRDVIETTGYVREIEESDADKEEIKDRISNINELISKVVAYEQKMEEETGDRATLSGFLEEVALVADIDNVDESDDKVLLMTLHSAKGLEFPVVYMAGVEDGVFPSYRTITSDDADDMEEERRLAYVGITRAQEDLHVLCAKQRMINGETQYNPVSRFVKEIPSNLLDNRIPTYKKYDLSFIEVEARDAVDKINDMFGLNIEVSFRDDFRQTDDENMIGDDTSASDNKPTAMVEDLRTR